MTDPIAEDKSANELEVEILLTEYKARRDEILLLAQRYGRFLMSVVSLISAIILVGRLVVGKESVILKFVSGASINWTPGLLLVAVPLLAFYLVSSAMDAVHMIILNGLRCGEIEKAINRIAGKALLVWEISVIPEVLWRRPFKGRYLWVQPNLLQGIFLSCLMGVAAAFLTGIAKEFMETSYFCLYAIFLWLGLLIMIQQWIVLIGPVRKDMAVQIGDVSTRYLPGNPEK